MISFLQLTRRVDFWIGRRYDLLFRIWWGKVRVATYIVVGQNVMPERVTILNAKPVSPIVSGPAELGGPALRVDFPRVGSNSKVAAADLVFGSGLVRIDSAVLAIAGVVASTGAIDPVVQATSQSIDTQLLIPLEEP